MFFMKNSLLQLHAAVLLWGFTGVLGRAISLSAPVLVWYRMIVAFFILALIITYRRQWQQFSKRDLFSVIGIGILFAIHWVSFFASIKFANASVAMICLATAGIFTALLYPFVSKTTFNIRELLLGLIAIAGVCCIYILQPEQAHPEQSMKNFKVGVLLGVVASLISAIFTILNKPLTQKYASRNLVFLEMLSGFLFLSMLAPFYIMRFPEQHIVPQGWDFLWIFILGYCCTVWGQSLAMQSLRKLSPFTVSLTVNIEPIYGIMLAFIFYQENEQLGWGFYVGVLLILASILLQTTSMLFRKKKRPALS